MEKIVIIGANEFQKPLIRKAVELGFETHVFAWRDGAVGAEDADYFYPVSIVEKDRILEICREIKPHAVVTIGSDLAMITVQYVASRLGLPCNTSRSIMTATNKYRRRQAFLEAGLPTPRFVLVDSHTPLDTISMKFPVIVKPTDRSGSRGITKLYHREGLEEAVKAAVEHSFEGKAVVEEFLEGEEYSFECISYEGVHYDLAMTKKFTTGEPHYIETGHLEPSGLPAQIYERAKSQVFQALDALEITMGASHAECKVDQEGQIHMIEVGPRMGGDCIGSDLVHISTGYDFVKMVIWAALGRRPELVRDREPAAAAVRFLFSEQDLRHLEDLKRETPEKLVSVSGIVMGNPSGIVDSSTRFGHYILECGSLEEAGELADLQEENNGTI